MTTLRRFDRRDVQSRARGGREQAERQLILYVEDNEDNWEVTRLALRQRFRLIWARTAKEACELLVAHREQIFAILMDIELKGSDLDGIQLAKLLRGSLQASEVPAYAASFETLRVPILFVTAYAAKYSERDLLAVGGNRRITKPVNFAELSLALATLDVEQLSTLAIDIVKSSASSGSTPRELFDRAEKDPVFRRRMEALVELGMVGRNDPESINGLRNIALAIVLVSLIPDETAAHAIVGVCLRRAVAARLLSRRLLDDRGGDCFSTGLLLDAGLITRARHDLLGALELVQSPAKDRSTRERAAGEVEHPRRGAELAKDWMLGREIIQAIRHHHDAAPLDEPIARIAWTAEQAAGLFEGGNARTNHALAIAAIEKLGLSRRDAEVLLRELPEAVSLAAGALDKELSSDMRTIDLADPEAIIADLDRCHQSAMQALETVGAEKERLVQRLADANRELRVAREKDQSLTAAVQRFFLPEKTSERTDAFELDAFHRAAEKCGGDWWWYDGESGLVLVGDVTGHGVDAAMVTASVVSSFRLLRKLSKDASLEELFVRLHEELLETAGGKYVMAASGVRFARNRLEWWSAGAPPLLLMRASGQVDEIVAQGTPLGSNTTSFTLGRSTQAISSGDRVLLFTDGVSDSMTPSGKPLGRRRLREILSSTQTRPIGAAKEVIAAVLDELRGGVPQTDDMTFVIVEVR